MSLFSGLKKLSKNPRFWLCLPWYAVAYSLSIVLVLLGSMAWLFEEIGGLIQKLSDIIDKGAEKLLHAKKVIKWIDKGFTRKCD